MEAGWYLTYLMYDSDEGEMGTHYAPLLVDTEAEAIAEGQLLWHKIDQTYAKLPWSERQYGRQPRIVYIYPLKDTAYERREAEYELERKRKCDEDIAYFAWKQSPEGKEAVRKIQEAAKERARLESVVRSLPPIEVPDEIIRKYTQSVVA